MNVRTLINFALDFDLTPGTLTTNKLRNNVLYIACVLEYSMTRIHYSINIYIEHSMTCIHYSIISRTFHDNVCTLDKPKFNDCGN